MATDPVCGMEVDEKKAEWVSQHRDRTYYFCSKMCKETFDDDPETFTRGLGSNE